MIGDTVHLEAEVTRTRPMPSMGGGMVIFGLQVLNQRNELVQEGEWTLLIKSQPDD
jgi:acyl dehydratase